MSSPCKVKNLIVGCGLSGMVIAERLASQRGEESLIIDRRDHIGGNIYDYTRAVEYKYYLDETSPRTLLSYEYSCPHKEGTNERYYPIPDTKNEQLFNQYKQKTKDLKNVYFLGRLGDYRYYNM